MRRDRSLRKRAKPDLTPPLPKVPAGPPWIYFCRLDARGKDVIDEWYMTLQKKARARLSRALDELRNRERTDWSRPFASPLGDHIYVIRFKDHSGIPQRVFGYFERNAFVMTNVAIEKDNAYIPANSGDLAETYRDEIARDFDRYTRSCHNRAR